MTKNKEIIKKQLKEKIINFFLSNTNKQYNYKQIAKSIGDIGIENRKHITTILYKLCSEEIIFEVTKGKFKISPAYLSKKKKIGPFITGKVEMKQTGKAYIISEELLEDVLIKQNNTKNALHEDKVKVRLFPKRKNEKIEGEIIEIIERKISTYVGIIKLSKHFAFVLPDNKSMPYDIFIPKEEIKTAQEGQKVVAEITEWPDHAKNPFGRIIKILGTPGENEVEISAIMEQYNLPMEFPDNVTNFANKINKEINPSEIKKRKDFRNKTTFTIDPYNAKDFDDALSVDYLKDGNIEVGVHIADVSHYVDSNNILDKEAYERATSVYLVDRVVPMLPEVLSNDVCSLNPKTDKLTFSAVFIFNKDFKLLKKWFGKTIINSNHRFTYEDVQEIIDSSSGNYNKEILLLNSIAKHYRDKRFKNGSLAFDRKEAKFKLDENGKPLDIYFSEQNDSHKLVEEFMLLANRTVAELIGNPGNNKKPNTFVYRVHDIPNPEKLNALKDFVSKFGYTIKTDKRTNISKSFNTLLEQIQGKGEENLIESLTIRTMAKAEYSVNNIGHYGLGFDYYTHFTSPIRRYPDLMVHRMLFSYLNNTGNFEENLYEEKCKHSSDREKLAQEAERDSIKYKQAEFLSTKIGQEYDGIISGVSKWGLFVELVENKCEGLIRLSDLDDDFYYLDEDNYQVIGHNTKKTYKLGDDLRVIIKSVNIFKKEIDFKLV